MSETLSILDGATFVVSDRNGGLRAAVSASRLTHCTMLDVTLGHDAEISALELIAAGARAVEADSGPLVVTVPATSEALMRQLEDGGFRSQGEYVSLMHRTTRPLAMPRMLPIAAKNAVGV